MREASEHQRLAPDSPFDSSARPQLQLGLFIPNCGAGYSISTYKADPNVWTYESNLRIALAAERAGFDFLFPVAKWKGYGGKTDYLGNSLETMTWASALLANTRHINIYSTVHVPLFHPAVAAKMGGDPRSYRQWPMGYQYRQRMERARVYPDGN